MPDDVNLFAEAVMKPRNDLSIGVQDARTLQMQTTDRVAAPVQDQQIVFLLIDNENLQLKQLSLPDHALFRVFIFSGKNQHYYPESLVHDLQPLGARCEYIKIDRTGKNVLDFYVAYYLGRLSAEHPGSRFVVMSKDKGFDPIIAHLKVRDVRCERIDAIASLNISMPQDPESFEERIEIIVGNLVKRQGLPRTRRSLKKTIAADLREDLTDRQLEEAVEGLVARRLVTFEGNKAHYRLDTPKE